jgi:hypothetical protein
MWDALAVHAGDTYSGMARHIRMSAWLKVQKPALQVTTLSHWVMNDGTLLGLPWTVQADGTCMDPWAVANNKGADTQL